MPHNLFGATFEDRSTCQLSWRSESSADPTPDTSQNSNDGTFSGFVSHATADPPDAADGFNGTSTGYINYPNTGQVEKASATGLDSATVSVVCWKWNNILTATDNLWVAADGGVFAFSITTRGGDAGDPYRFGFNTSATTGQWETDDPYTEDNWEHLAITMDASSIDNLPTLYIDGVAKTVGFGLTEAQNPTGTFDSGTDEFSFSNDSSPLGGRGDEVGYFSEILTSTDVNNIMSKGLAGEEGEVARRVFLTMNYDYDELYNSRRN